MHSIALRMLAVEEQSETEHESRLQRTERRQLRDAMNPLELPQALFQQFYRINKPAFKYLLDVLTVQTQPAKKAFAVSPMVKLSAVLRFFAEGGYQAGVGKDNEMGLAQCSLSKVLANVLNVFEEHLCTKWISICKTVEEKKKIALGFNSMQGIPRVCGCVDGTHIPIIAPFNNKHRYYNRKGYYSLNVMLVCDNEQRIRYVDASHPGACQDASIWNASHLRAYFEQNYSTDDSNYWLLGDTRYPLEPWLLTPYRRPEGESNKMKFNEVHSQCHKIIQRTIGVLKSRWRCLLGSKELHYAPKKAAQITNVCCALHNICIYFKCNDVVIDCEVVNSFVEESSNAQESEVANIVSSQYLKDAQNTRRNIAKNL